ncbi:MAG: site-specific DNA-methyltransferase [Zoogloeaceae bacterium]|nr:site-specific DNA-methyltransferase [Zoogloeaceae bacterium]
MTRAAPRFSASEQVVLFEGDCLELLASLPDESMQLIVTSPPYNLGKAYERKSALDRYLEWQDKVIEACIRVLRPEGSICWQVGNFVQAGAIVPLDIALYPSFARRGLKLRNRIIWHFEHGLHCSRRLSGRHETILWFTKTEQYLFDLDRIRVPQKYPGKKYFKGPKAGQYSCNPLGKNPGDVWAIPNVKNNHVEKTVHPCQFPVELVERLVLSMTRDGDWVLDPFAGVGSALVAALKNERRAVGAELSSEYCAIARERISQCASGFLKSRPMNQPIYDPQKAGRALTTRAAPHMAQQLPLSEVFIEQGAQK